ncbi:MAG: HD domain-containing protein [Negativicutes bacterium]|nr:HD domain-containing protein [Negativicutes bacterium]
MDISVLKDLSCWFTDYVKTYATADEQIQSMINTKEEHTHFVARYCRELALSLKLPAEDVRLAEAVGLCHDVGRFKQATLYRTFQDPLSVNHGLLGISELKAEGIDRRLASEEWKTLAFAVSCHNAKAIPGHPAARPLVFAKIIRDADKLDIYRVLPPQPSESGCSPGFIAAMLSGQMLDYRNMKTRDDRKLMMLSWIYDINFPWTLDQIVRRGYIEKLFDAIPASPPLAEIKAKMQEYLNSALQTR